MFFFTSNAFDETRPAKLSGLSQALSVQKGYGYNTIDALLFAPLLSGQCCAITIGGAQFPVVIDSLFFSAFIYGSNQNRMNTIKIIFVDRR
ncbi:MAG: hypothetical protein ACXVA0_24675, partial [Mucilaginibacter sp.]